MYKWLIPGYVFRRLSINLNMCCKRNVGRKWVLAHLDTQICYCYQKWQIWLISTLMPLFVSFLGLVLKLIAKTGVPVDQSQELAKESYKRGTRSGTRPSPWYLKLIYDTKLILSSGTISYKIYSISMDIIQAHDLLGRRLEGRYVGPQTYA